MVCAAALPHLEASEGLIVNMSSTYGSKAGAPLSYYAASQAAVEHLTRCWALEFAPKKIRVNAIASGPRSEERRVGKEGVSTCRSRMSPYHSQKTRKNKTETGSLR